MEHNLQATLNPKAEFWAPRQGPQCVFANSEGSVFQRLAERDLEACRCIEFALCVNTSCCLR